MDEDLVGRRVRVGRFGSGGFGVYYLMADCILTILRDEPLARQLRAEAPKTLRQLGWRNQAQKVQAVYRGFME